MSRWVKLMSSVIAAACLGACAGTRDGLGRFPPGEAPRVSHIRIEVSNMKASIAFYHDLLGLRVRSEGADFSWLEAGDFGVALSAKPWGWVTPRPQGVRPGWGMYPHLAVGNVEALTAKLKAAGCQIVQEPEKHSFGTEAFVADPDGYVWALVN